METTIAILELFWVSVGVWVWGLGVRGYIGDI